MFLLSEEIIFISHVFLAQRDRLNKLVNKIYKGDDYPNNLTFIFKGRKKIQIYRIVRYPLLQFGIVRIPDQLRKLSDFLIKYSIGTWKGLQASPIITLESSRPPSKSN